MPTKSPVRVALIGAGRIGANHAELIARHTPGAVLVAVADPTPSAERLASHLGVDVVERSAETVFARSDVDAVVITTPARSHAELV
ncbi:MAG: Gfo/Idh/MocA family oxidoreductase, partial [Mycolicibacterium sp.]|nr:Gfo/Idh/MocA family oxidoreductase [Mycolicibacterium sp.]